MKKVVIIGLAFALFNFFAFWGHTVLFQSNWPYLSWVTIIAHIVLLIIFPYKKVFTYETEESKNVS
jgi:tetrahydromethanopterin S-methyltransferase subunit E